jgi:DNA-binding CsgD family transcriptional regulator
MTMTMTAKELGTPREVLVRAAGPVLDELEADLAGAPVAFVLTDADGQILDRRVSDESLRVRMDSVLLAPGFVHAEHNVGTDGIGAALAQRRPVLVNGDEQFTDAPTGAVRAAAPISDPVSGRIRGVLGLTSSVDDANDLMLPFVARAARQIEDRILDDSAVADRLLLYRFLQKRRGAKGPVVLVTERTLVANAAGDALIDPEDEPLLRDSAQRLRDLPSSESVTVVLRGGASVRVQADAIFKAGVRGGALLRLTPLSGASTTRPRRGSYKRFGWESLTNTERSVADLVADGLTNRQASEKLFLSHHTVGFHLRSIFRKLDVTSRVELARAMGEHRAAS